MDSIFTKQINDILLKIANYTDNIFSEESIKILSTGKARKRTSENQETYFQKLITQIPLGVYTRPDEILRFIIETNKKNSENSKKFSPFSVNYKEFSPCKTMKFNKGNIITGRDREIEKILLTLCKKEKRGVILTGHPGTGKTSIVQAINSRLIEKNVPRRLIGSQVYIVDVPLIFSTHKEDPIGVILKILERAAEYDKAILFIDEVHQLLGQKMNDILKPFLTEQIRFIGSTTINEYHAIVTEDTALERRFTIVNVPEPNIEETISMVKNTKVVYENDHKCIIPNDTVEYLVTTGSRFLGHRKNPDKSLDLMDIACTYLYEKEIKTVFDDKRDAVDDLDEIVTNYEQVKSIKTITGSRTLTKEYIDMAISSLTGIEFGHIQKSLTYKGVLDGLRDKIIGQDKQLEVISNVVNIFKYVNNNRQRPVSIILLVGPEGVGKRTAAMELAKNLYGNENCFIEYDLGSLKSDFMITELKGAPPGYVGYKNSGYLIKKIRNNPQSVIYFNNINQAHPSIIQYVLNCCRTAKMMDSAEREASLINAVVIYSISLSDEEMEKLRKSNAKTMGFAAAKEDKEQSNIDKLDNIVTKDITSAVDDVIIFNKLSDENLGKIFDLNINKYLEIYKVDVDVNALKETVLKDAKNGSNIISKLDSEIPKLFFQYIKNLED